MKIKILKMTDVDETLKRVCESNKKKLKDLKIRGISKEDCYKKFTKKFIDLYYDTV